MKAEMNAATHAFNAMRAIVNDAVLGIEEFGQIRISEQITLQNVSE